jgi:hypothetical protein
MREEEEEGIEERRGSRSGAAMAEEMPRVWCNSSKAESRAPHSESNQQRNLKEAAHQQHIHP